MIIIGTTKPKLVNPKHIITLELKKGKITAFVKGEVDNDGDIDVKDLTVRESWTVIAKTAISTHYVNSNSFKEAVNNLTSLAQHVDEDTDPVLIKKEMQKAYGKQENSK